jgi:hypothetical protein
LRAPRAASEDGKRSLSEGATMHGFRIAVAAAALASLAAPARAIDVADGKLTVSGFGHWGYGQTGNENAYLVGTDEGNYDNAQFSLSLTATPQENIVVAGQIFLTSDGEATIDWAFGEYRVSDALRVRAGKVKNPFGIFMEVKDVGTLRPFFTLPQSIYGTSNFAAESYLGAGFTGAWEGERWGLGYDFYAGALQIPAFEPTGALQDELGVAVPPPFDFAAVDVVEEEAQPVFGGRLVLTTPLDGLSFRLTGYEGSLEVPDAEKQHLTCFGVSAEWALDRFQIRGEAFRAREGDVETNLGAYGEVAWTFLPKLQAALRYEVARQKKDGVPDDSPLLRHDEVAFGLAYWASASLVFKASYHHVEGNRFAVPAVSADDGSIPLRTDLFVTGAQFSF